MFERNELNLDSRFEDNIRHHMTKTFAWMILGVVVSGLVAFMCYNSFDFLYLLYTTPMMPMVLLIAQIGIVVVFSARLFKMRVGTVRILFLAYAALLGVTLTSWLLVYDMPSVAIAFGLSAAYFLALTVIGYTTKINLMRLGPILMVGLVVLIVSEVVMMFMGMDTNTLLLSGIGLALFTGLTAYDVQKMKNMYMEFQHDDDMMSRLSVYNAFNLYLDFINIFLYILRFVGNSKD